MGSNKMTLDQWEILPVNERRALILDISAWGQDIGTPTVPIDGAIHRLSWGLHTDSKYINHGDKLADITDALGGYHYYSTAVPWLQQVDLLLERSSRKPNGIKYSSIWWDFEEKNNVFSARAGREAAEAIRYLRMSFDGLIGIYSNNNEWDVFLERAVRQNYLNEILLWLSWPGKIKNPFSIAIDEQPQWGNWRGRWPNRRLVPLKRPPGTWDLWQYTFFGDPKKFGVIGKEQVDASVYNGTRADWRKRLKLDTLEPPLPPGPPNIIFPMPVVNDLDLPNEVQSNREAINELAKRTSGL